MAEFFNTLYDYKRPEDVLLVWTLPDKRSVYFKDISEASKYSVSLKDKDVYFGVGLGAKEKSSRSRFLSDEIISIPGLWADIDIAHDVHQKKNLFPTMEDAKKFLESLPVKASVIVSSGHGIQAYWLFKEPWTFDNLERIQVELLSQQWKEVVRSAADIIDISIDSTHDLARVMRVPGTVNNKSVPVPVSIIEMNDVRYDPDDFKNIIPEDLKGLKGPIPSVQFEGIALSPSAKPSFDLFNAMRANDPKFNMTYEHKRKDMTDSSMSAYDMSLANMAVLSGWPDQEVVNLLIAHRRHYNADLKLRESYYKKTLQAAHRVKAMAKADDIVTESVREAENDDDKKKHVIENLSKMFGINMTGIVKYVSDKSEYQIITDSSKVIIGSIENLTRKTLFRNIIGDLTGKWIPNFSPRKWDVIVQAMLDVCESKDIGYDVSMSGKIGEWVRLYLESRIPSQNIDDACKARHPFIMNGCTHIFLDEFKKFVYLAKGENVSTKTIATHLRANGCQVMRIMVNENRYHAWRLQWNGV